MLPASRGKILRYHLLGAFYNPGVGVVGRAGRSEGSNTIQGAAGDAEAPPPLQVPVLGFVVPLVKSPPPHLVGKTPAVLAPGVVPKKNPPPPRPIRP